MFKHSKDRCKDREKVEGDSGTAKVVCQDFDRQHGRAEGAEALSAWREHGGGGKGRWERFGRHQRQDNACYYLLRVITWRAYTS